ncbi:MAG: hypothetical protein A2Y17_13595 [Clostridiales bacterium GWF2_38_85]|nr:MAG: hypothetical protein A2Y17_13595 [Clostridiales bacterium GWF2_38_85]
MSHTIKNIQNIKRKFLLLKLLLCVIFNIACKGGEQVRIVVTTMSMNIGGAETHVFELVKELDRRGFEVLLISSGGIIADRLKNECKNVKTETILLHKRTPILFLSFFNMLLKVRKFKPDLIHAHGRIPSFISKIVSKLLRIPFIVTAHGLYKDSILTKALTYWGDVTLAVSSDIKTHLNNYYKVNKNNILIQNNGIDINKYKILSDEQKNASKKEFLETLELYENQRIILSVSRLEPDAYLCVYELLEAAERLYEINQNSILVIAGGGGLLNDIREKAAQINQKLDKDFIFILGSRSDIELLANIADCFVGSARSAIEAATCGCPVIVAGGAYLGRVNHENFDECINTNFTARLRKGFDISRMITEINKAERSGFEAVLQAYISKNYSIENSCNTAIEAYHTALRRKSKFDCVMFGYYGCGNFGDDALLEIILRNLRNKIPYLKICVAVGKYLHPSSYAIQNDVRMINRYNPLSIFHTMLHAKVCFFGGGSLLQDTTSTRSFIYYMTLLRLAKIFRLKTIFYANGIGEITKGKNRERLHKFKGKIDLCLIRDMKSYNLLKDVAPDISDNIHITADECVLFEPKRRTKLTVKPKKNLCLILKEMRSCDFDGIFTALNSFCNEYTLIPMIVIMDIVKDAAISNKALQSVKNSCITEIKDEHELIELMEDSAVIMSTRLHGLVFATVAGIAPVAVTNEPKLISFMEQLNETEFTISSDYVNENSMYEMLKKAFDERAERNAKAKESLEKLRKEARQNADEVVKFLGDKEGK